MARSKSNRPLRLALGGISAAGVEIRPDPVHVGRLIAEKGVKGHAFDQRWHADGVVSVAG
jgi:hypothetical protein